MQQYDHAHLQQHQVLQAVQLLQLVVLGVKVCQQPAAGQSIDGIQLVVIYVQHLQLANQCETSYLASLLPCCQHLLRPGMEALV